MTLRWTAALLLAAGLAGCAEDATEPTVVLDCDRLPEPWYHPGDAQSERLAAAIPGYAGLRVFPDHSVGVWATDVGDALAHEYVLRNELADMLDWSGVLTYTEVRYAYKALNYWKAAFAGVSGLSGVGYDFLHNAVEVIVVDWGAAREVMRIRDCNDIPVDAVDIYIGVSGQD